MSLTVLVAEGERAAHEGLLHLVDVAHFLAGLEDHAQLLLGVGQVALGRRLDVEQLEDADRGDVHEPGDRTGDHVEPAKRHGDGQRRSLGLADGDRLGHQFPEDDGDEGDEDEGDDRGQQSGFMADAEQVGEGHGAQPAEAQAGDGDAELRGREIGVEVVDDVVGHPGAAAAVGGQLGHARVAHLDDGELGHARRRRSPRREGRRRRSRGRWCSSVPHPRTGRGREAETAGICGRVHFATLKHSIRHLVGLRPAPPPRSAAAAGGCRASPSRPGGAISRRGCSLEDRLQQSARPPRRSRRRRRSRGRRA